MSVLRLARPAMLCLALAARVDAWPPPPPAAGFINAVGTNAAFDGPAGSPAWDEADNILCA